MAKKKEKVAIINRSFWPIYPVIGEALLRFSERESKYSDVSVIMQDHSGIRSQLLQHNRGEGVNFFPCKAWSVSGSGILRRILDAVFFMVWVFLVLIWKRPTKVYVSTDPPVLVPFIVMVYCKLFSSKYVYHLQDIHPEAANVVIPVNPFVFKILQKIDSLVMRNAELLITITEEMACEIKGRSGTKAPIVLLPNPSVSFDDFKQPLDKVKGFTFCGNAGRLQRIPLLISAIDAYCKRGGSLPFVFAGAGVHAEDLKKLADKYSNVDYRGLITPAEAASLNSEYQWALLPIEDEVTRYAFPSKSSSYVFSGAFIAAVCGEHTSVAEWVSLNKLGAVVEPSEKSLCAFFSAVENNQVDYQSFDVSRAKLKKALSFEVFVNELSSLVCPKEVANEK